MIDQYAPRFSIPPGDTLPTYSETLTHDSGIGLGLAGAVDLTGKTLAMRFQLRGGSSAAASVPVENTQVSPTSGRGRCTIDVNALQGALAPGYYEYRIVTTDLAGDVESFPKGGFWLFYVPNDFRTGGSSPVLPPIKVGAAFTIDIGTDLPTTFAALDVSRFLPGQTFVRVRGVVGLFALDAAASNGGVANPAAGIYASNDGSLLWVNC